MDEILPSDFDIYGDETDQEAASVAELPGVPAHPDTELQDVAAHPYGPGGEVESGEHPAGEINAVAETTAAIPGAETYAENPYPGGPAGDPGYVPVYTGHAPATGPAQEEYLFMLQGPHVESLREVPHHEKARAIVTDADIEALRSGRFEDRPGGKRRIIKRTWLRRTVKIGVAFAACIVILASCIFAYGKYRYSQIKRIAIAGIAPLPTSGDNADDILFVGSDTLSGAAPSLTMPPSQATFLPPSSVATSAPTAPPTTAPRSAGAAQAEVMMLFRLDATSGRASVLSIPTATVVTPPGGSAETLEQAFDQSPSRLVSDISSVFHIPINHYVDVDFAGMNKIVTSLGGLRLAFNYPVLDTFSGLYVPQTGCQTISGVQALELLRSQQFQYQQNGSYNLDTSGPLGVSQRQRTVLGALGSRAQSQIGNPFQTNAFVGNFVSDITLDASFGIFDILNLLSNLGAYNLASAPTYTFTTSPVGLPDGSIVLQYDPVIAQAVATNFLATSKDATQITMPTTTPTSVSGFPTSQPDVSGGVSSVAGQQSFPTFMDPHTC